MRYQLSYFVLSFALGIFLYANPSPLAIRLKHYTQESCYVLPFLANPEESRTGIRHEVGFAALGVFAMVK